MRSHPTKQMKMRTSGYGTISEEDDHEDDWSKERVQTKPWKDMICPSRLTLPFSFLNMIHRMKRNALAYRTNYVVVMLLVVLLTLLRHPICVIIYCALVAAWVVLYLVRDNPLRSCGYEIDQRLVATSSLLLVTAALMFVSDVRAKVVVGLCVRLFTVSVHAVMREAEEEEEEAGNRLRHAASSSFTT